MRRHLVMLVALALLWGASFMFIKIADRSLAPATLILGRLGFAAVTLALIVSFTLGWREAAAATKANWRWLLVVALVNTAVPFWLLAWGETRIASGLASIIQGAVPVFNALFAFAFFREVRVTGTRLLGFALGFVGVALIVGGQPSGKLLGAVAVVGMALCYALGGLFMGRHLRGVSPIVIALTSTSIAAAVDLPAGIVQAPHAWPGWEPVASVVVLALLRPDHRPGGSLRLPRGVPHSTDCARVWLDLSGRAVRWLGLRRALPDPRRRRARHRRCCRSLVTWSSS
jgi:drug/metabolite transporter (DMT)-like permease